MKERTFSHIILTLGTSFGFYAMLNKPYGFTFLRMGGIFLILFFSWAIKSNYENHLKEVVSLKHNKTQSANKTSGRKEWKE